MGYVLFMVALTLYVGLLAFIGTYFMKRQRNMSDFWIAGREVGFLNVGFSAAASWLTAGALFFVTGLFVLFGIGSIWIFVVPNVLALMIIALLSKRIKKLPTITQPELLEMRYSPILRAPIAVFITIMMILFAVADFKGFSYVLSVFYGIPEIYGVLIIMIAVALYTSLGGFRAVVWTDMIQFIFLSIVAFAVAYMALNLTSDVTTVPASEWWNPLLVMGSSEGGILMAIFTILILQIALLPGWITEQDPWQKVWAARDSKTARRGMLLGALLMGIVFFALFLTAIGFRNHLPLPQDVPASELLYLQFILENSSPLMLTIFAIGFAAASMSCIDTFATSGASCISRDIYQRFIKPDSPMSRMRIVNRLAVIMIIVIAGVISLRVGSILDAIIMGTVVGSASVFFPLLGGMFWKGATKWGGFTGMVLGGTTQVSLLILESFIGPLDAISLLLQEHGVLLSMSISGLSFFVVSLVTSPSAKEHLAPFFEDVAVELASSLKGVKVDERMAQYLAMLKERKLGNKIYLSCELTVDSLDWGKFVTTLTSKEGWIAPSGEDTVYRVSEEDLVSGVQVIRGEENQVWLSSEHIMTSPHDPKREMLEAILEVKEVLASLGMRVRDPRREV
jgi:SSS family solute:Na+ symporter